MITISEMLGFHVNRKPQLPKPVDNCSSDTQITQRKPDYAELPSQYTPQDGQAHLSIRPTCSWPLDEGKMTARMQISWKIAPRNNP